MSIEAMSCAWHYSKHSSGNLLVLLAISDYAGEEGICWPGTKALMKKCRMSESNVRRCIDALIASGEVILIRPGTGRQSALYRINFEQLRRFKEQGCQIAGGSVHEHPVRGSMSGHPPLPPTNTKPLKNRQSSPSDILPLALEPGEAESTEKSFRDRFAAIYNRRPGTKWSADEEKAWGNCWPKHQAPGAAWLKTFDEDLCMVERYYKSERKKEKSVCRTILLRLLRHWPGEVDRARAWCERHPVKSRPVRFAAPEPPPGEAAPLTDPTESRKFCEDFERHHGRLPWGWERQNGELVFTKLQV